MRKKKRNTLFERERERERGIRAICSSDENEVTNEIGSSFLSEMNWRESKSISGEANSNQVRGPTNM